LYQRWIYKIDKQRVNEFGTSGETPEEHAARTGEGRELVVNQDPNAGHQKSE